jgi:lipoprotein-anchoring transpeptidase ErfK/SrfK
MKRKKRKVNLSAITVFITLICFTVILGVVYFNLSPIKTIIFKNTASTIEKNITASSSENLSSQSSSSSSEATSQVQSSQISLQDAAKPLWINVSIANQNVTVYDADNNTVECFICSTGSPGFDTPKGTFSVYTRGKSFFSQKYQEGGYYWVAFYEDYYFHSVPFDKNGNIIQSIANDLGHEDSHGCVHLSISDSEWIYDNIPNGTKVVIE